jgi:dihydropteroate synthase
MKISCELFPNFVIGDDSPVKVMAIVNISKESIYKSSYIPKEHLLETVKDLLSKGADIIDIGARSTFLRAEKITLEEEIDRLKAGLEIILPEFPKDKVISLDTLYSDAARVGLDLCKSHGVNVILNDVSNLRVDPKYADMVVEYGCPILLMASEKVPGDTKTMAEVIKVLDESVNLLVSKGYPRNKIILDPGVGKWVIDKTAEYDLALIANFEEMRSLGLPLLMALSRKSFIGDMLGHKDPKDRYFGTVAATAISVFLGAHIVRVHDVNQELMDVIRLSKYLRNARNLTK